MLQVACSLNLHVNYRIAPSEIMHAITTFPTQGVCRKHAAVLIYPTLIR